MRMAQKDRRKEAVFSANHVTLNIVVDDLWSVLHPSPYSQLLMDNLVFSENEKRGSVLDLGTGSGILGIYALKSGCRHVTLTDISQSASECANWNLQCNGIPDQYELIEKSDLFERLAGRRFNLIICNPPPLPDIPELRTRPEIDQALLSGSDGMHFVLRLLSCFDSHLAKDGRLVIAHPSFWDVTKTSAMLKNKGYSYRVLGKRLLSIRIYPYFDERQYQTLKRQLSELSKQNGDRYFSIPGTEFSLSVWEIKGEAWG